MADPQDIEQTAAKTVAEFQMYDDDSVLVALISGGADSTALLHLLTSGTLPRFGTLHVLHINHMLRDAQSDGDAAFVQELCGRLDVPYEIASVDVAAYAEQLGLNVEEAGRAVRYEQAKELLDSLGADASGRIVTAHTLDDRVETFLWRALWGAGTGALGSIAPTRNNIIRPLITSTRAEILDYLRAHGLSWREDATNADRTRTRAAIRHTLVPAIEQLRPGFRRNLERTMDLCAADDTILTRMERGFARDFARRGADGAVLFDATAMRTLEPAMRARTVRSALFDAFPEARRMDAEHIDALVAAFDADTFARDIGWDLRAELLCDTLKVAKNRQKGSDG